DVTMQGFSVDGLHGLASDPDTGLLYAIVRDREQFGPRHLATINPTTGIASDIGVISRASGFAGIAFGPGTTAVPQPATLPVLTRGPARPRIQQRGHEGLSSVGGPGPRHADAARQRSRRPIRRSASPLASRAVGRVAGDGLGRLLRSGRR